MSEPELDGLEPRRALAEGAIVSVQAPRNENAKRLSLQSVSETRHGSQLTFPSYQVIQLKGSSSASARFIIKQILWKLFISPFMRIGVSNQPNRFPLSCSQAFTYSILFTISIRPND